MPKADYINNAVLDFTTGRTAMPTNLTRTIWLWEILPAADGTGGVEMSGLGYGRYTVSSTLDFGVSASGEVSSLREISFGTSLGGGPYLEGLSIHDGSGNFLRIMKFPDRQFWDPDDGYKVPAGGILLEEQ